MARAIATNTTVELGELLDFVRPRHRLLLATTTRDGRPQISPVSGGVDADDRIVISTYPTRVKTRNAERDPQVSVLVLSDDLERSVGAGRRRGRGAAHAGGRWPRRELSLHLLAEIGSGIGMPAAKAARSNLNTSSMR